MLQPRFHNTGDVCGFEVRNDELRIEGTKDTSAFDHKNT